MVDPIRFEYLGYEPVNKSIADCVGSALNGRTIEECRNLVVPHKNPMLYASHFESDCIGALMGGSSVSRTKRVTKKTKLSSGRTTVRVLRMP